MKYLQISPLSLLAAIVLLFQAGCDKHGQDRKTIERVFDRAIAASAEKDGTTYASLVTKDGLDDSAKSLKLALTGKKAEVAALPMPRRYEILLVRLMGSKAEIKDLDGKGFVEWQVTTGLQNYNIQPEGYFGLGKITFADNTHASGVITMAAATRRTSQDFDSYRSVARMPTPYSVRFLLEEGQWKFDLSGFDAAVDYEIRKRIKATGLPEDAALLKLLNQITGKEVPQKIWNGMLR